MAKSSRAARPEPHLTREARITLSVAVLFGALAVLLFSWEHLFPLPPEQLVEVAWKHDCTCATGWIASIRAAGFTVRDYEMDDTRTLRHRWRVPDSVKGCHPASYLGYFLDGHVSAGTLRQIARERPQAIGIQQVDTTQSGADGVPKMVSSQLLLISADGAATPWPTRRTDDAQN